MARSQTQRLAKKTDDPPRSFDELRAVIAARYPELRGQLKTIAQYALDNPNDLALQTVTGLAELNGVQPSTIVRFAKAFGFDGFSDLQKVFRSRLVVGTASYADRIQALQQKTERSENAEETVLSEFVDQGVTSLELLREHTAPERLEEAVAVLARARDIYLLAQRRAFPVAFDLSYALGRLERRCHLVDGVGGLLNHQAMLATPEDVIIAVSFKPYSPSVVEIVTERSEAGVPVVAITDSAVSPIALEADLSFEIQEDQRFGFRTLVAPMCLAQALVVMLGQSVVERPRGKKAKR